MAEFRVTAHTRLAPGSDQMVYRFDYPSMKTKDANEAKRFAAELALSWPYVRMDKVFKTKPADLILSYLDGTLKEF